MGEKIKVSVMVTTYNLENYIRQTLDSVLGQKTDFAFEILIGDDGSSDGTVAVCEDYSRRHPGKIKIYEMPREEGREYNKVERSAANRLNLWKHAQGDYACFLDGDDYYLNDRRLQRMVDILEKKENADCIMCAHNLMMHYDASEKSAEGLGTGGIQAGEEGRQVQAGAAQGQDGAARMQAKAAQGQAPEGTRDFPLCRAKKERRISFEEYWSLMFLQANALLFRNLPKLQQMPEPLAANFDDNNITYWLFQHGGMYYLPECMGAYRQTQGSSWNSNDELKKACSNLIGYSIELLVAPENEKISQVRHYKDFKGILENLSVLGRESSGVFYQTAERFGLKEALRIYDLGAAPEKEKEDFRRMVEETGRRYRLARMRRAVKKILKRY